MFLRQLLAITSIAGAAGASPGIPASYAAFREWCFRVKLEALLALGLAVAVLAATHCTRG
jgi:hypothetical protein